MDNNDSPENEPFTGAGEPDQVEPTPLAVLLCSEIFGGAYRTKLTVPLELAAQDLEDRCLSRTTLPRQVVNTDVGPYPPSDSEKESGEWIDQSVDRIVGPSLLADQSVTDGHFIEDNLRQTLLSPVLEYEFDLFDADAMIHQLHTDSQEDQVESPARTLGIELLVAGVDSEPQTEQWVKVYPLFQGAVGQLSPAALWDLVRSGVVQSCQPAKNLHSLGDMVEEKA
jgi:hypothetical protein